MANKQNQSKASYRPRFKTVVLLLMSLGVIFTGVVILVLMMTASITEIQNNDSAYRLANVVADLTQACAERGGIKSLELFLRNVEKHKILETVHSHRSPVAVQDVGKRESDIPPDSVEAATLKDGTPREIVDKKAHTVCYVRANIAEDRCLACHPSAKKGDVLGVSSVTISTEKADMARAKLNWAMILIFMTIGVVEVIFVIVLLAKENASRSLQVLQKTRDELEVMVKERTAEIEQSYVLQKILNNLLSISLQDVPKESMLEQFIDEIIAVPLLEVKPTGAIFLVEDQPGILVMKAQRGMASPLLTVCSKVPFGRCLCGRAAASSKIEFADCVDERHENRFDKISPHGHYCIPIISSAKKVTGVLNLYTKAGLPRNKKAEDFLYAVSNTIASTIERKNAEEELKTLNMELNAIAKKLTVSNRELQDFVHIAAHDLKAPLCAMGKLTEWLDTDYGDKLDKQARNQINLLKGRVNRMNSHIDAILQYSAIGNNHTQKEKINLNTLINEVIGDLAPPENIEISIENELPTVMCEKPYMFQLFWHLLTNAIEYTDKPRGLIKIGCTKEDGFWKFSIADNGPGIEEKYFEKIFQLFQTLAPRDEREATGIGLSIAKKIVELYGGKIWVKSQPALGSTFFFTFPKQQDVAAENCASEISPACALTSSL